MEISTIKNFVKPLYIDIYTKKEKKKKFEGNGNYLIEYDSYIELENLL